MSALDAHADRTAAQTVAWFAEGWAAPTYEQFCQHFLPRMHPDVRLTQPLARTGVGHDAFRMLFARLFATIPDLHARVLRWGTEGDAIFIELALEGTLGGRPIRWQTCDRLTVTNGLIVERRSFFDPTRLVLTIASRPWAWPTLMIRAAAAPRRSRQAATA